MKAVCLSATRACAPVALVTALVIAAAVVLASPAAALAADPGGCPAADPVSITAAECAATTPIVPSLDPEWSDAFVPPPMPKLRSAALCRPLNALFYAAIDWIRLAQKLRANPSACADYYVSVPPLTADKSRLRTGEAARIRALGAQMHVIAEINITGWTSWVAAGNGSWFDAGVEARRRMAAAGFDVDAGDIWGVNEFSAAVRQGSGTARDNMRELLRGLYVGDGTGPAVQGLVWVTGIGQSTADLSTYKANLKSWLQDAGFWADMSQYVRFWSQEEFGDARRWAVPGADLATRRDRLVDYLEHVNVLSEVSPPPLADVKAFIRATDAPLANAAWAFQSSFGYTFVPSQQMQAYVASQTYALRSYQERAPWRNDDSFGFAWSPTNDPPPFGLTKPEYTAQTATILDQLAASIHASDAPSEDAGIAACGPDATWCATDIDGASFNLAWRIFGTWTQPLAVDSTATVDEDASVEISLVASDPDGEQLTYEIVAQPQHGTLAGEGALQMYTPAHDFNGADSFTFRVSDGFMSSRVATVRIVVTPVNDAPTLELAPAGPIDEAAAPVTLTAHATDVDGDPVTYAWTTTVGTVISSGSTATFAADDGPAVAHVTVTGDDGHGGTGSATIDVEVRNVPPTADAGADAEGLWGLPVSLSGSATDPSAADTAAGLHASWSFGDSSPVAGAFAVSHAYAEPGTFTATLTATDKDGGTGADTATVTIRQRTATVAYAGPSGLNASSAAVAARLGDASGAPSARLGGHTLTIALGPHTCTATTDATGLARCAIDASALPLGPTTVTATFASDKLYTSASASAPVVLYALPAGGIFVIGDTTAAGAVTFWSPQWRLVNGLSSGPAPASFKGFAAAAAPACGVRWTATASSGFDHAPVEVPGWVGVVVATTVRKDGSTISGDTARILVVRIDSYDPSVLGRGTVAARAC
jgi:PKD repeat protein